MGIKHTFVSAKADSSDASKIQPSHWNADHDLSDFKVDYITQVTNKLEVDSSEWIWSRTNGIDAIGDLTAVGSKVITLDKVPYGLSIGNYVRISGGSGVDEVAPITGITGNGGDDFGTIIITTANTHSGSWIVGTASSGIQEALYVISGPVKVSIPTGEWPIYGPIFIPQGTQPLRNYKISGNGRYLTRLMVDQTFPLTVSGVFIVKFDGNPAKQAFGPTLEDFGIIFKQPWGSPRSSFTHWPPAIFGLGIHNVHVYQLYIAGAWDGILLDGYPQDSPSPTLVGGQHIIDDLQISAFNVAIDLRNMGDICRIHKLHNWPYTEQPIATAEAQNPMYDPNVTGVKAEGLAGLYISDSFFICGKALNLIGGNSIVGITNTSFDVFARIEIGAAGGTVITISNAVFYQNQSNGGFTCSAPAITYTGGGGQLSVSNCIFYKNAIGFPVILINSLNGFNPGYAQVMFNGNKFYENSGNAGTESIFKLTGGPGGLVYATICDNQISYTIDAAYTKPMLLMTGIGFRLTCTGNSNTGVGSGTWLNINTDGYHRIIANNFDVNWGASLPASKLLGDYQDNLYYYNHSIPTSIKTTGVHVISGATENIVCNAVGGAIQLNLPLAYQAPGMTVLLKKIDSTSNPCFFQVAGADLIDGATSASVNTQYASIKLFSNGVDAWFKV